MLNLIQAFIGQFRDEEGQTFVEYALVIGGVSLLLLIAFATLDDTLGNVVTDITTALNPA